MKKFASTLGSFSTEFQPFMDEINKKEEAIVKYAGGVTMERIKGIVLHGVGYKCKILTQG